VAVVINGVVALVVLLKVLKGEEEGEDEKGSWRTRDEEGKRNGRERAEEDRVTEQ